MASITRQGSAEAAVEEVSHLVGTLARWSSSPPAPSCGTVRRGAGAARRRSRFWRCCGRRWTRPSFDPGLAGGLRAWLEDSAFEDQARPGATARGPSSSGARRLLGSTGGPRRFRAGGTAERRRTSSSCHGVGARAVPPAGQRRDARRPAGRRRSRRSAPKGSGRVRSCATSRRWPDRSGPRLSDAVSLHTDHLLALVPRLASGSLPRTDDRVTVPLAGGRIVLQGRLRPPDRRAGRWPGRRCAPWAVSTGGPRPKERGSLHYLALLETLRSGTPPFRLALGVGVGALQRGGRARGALGGPGLPRGGLARRWPCDLRCEWLRR